LIWTSEWGSIGNFDYNLGFTNNERVMLIYFYKFLNTINSIYYFKIYYCLHNECINIAKCKKYCNKYNNIWDLIWLINTLDIHLFVIFSIIFIELLVFLVIKFKILFFRYYYLSFYKILNHI
jgi:hypothetical protein